MKKNDFCFKSDSIEVWYRVRSFKKFRRKVKNFTEQIQKTGRPLVLTAHGKARFVVQDAKSYEGMLQLIDRLEAIEGIRRGLEAVERVEVRPAEQVLEELRRKYKIRKSHGR